VSKFNKNILSLYKRYTDDEIYNMVEQSLPRYIKLTKSEEIAKEYLKKHNTPLYRNSGNERIKIQHSKLMICAKLRNINVPESLYAVEVTVNDIIQRIIENKYEMVSTIDEYCYKWDGYCGDGQWDVEEIINSDEYDGATIREMEVCKFYNDIIDNVKEFYEAKKLVLTEWLCVLKRE